MWAQMRKCWRACACWGCPVRAVSIDALGWACPCCHHCTHLPLVGWETHPELALHTLLKGRMRHTLERETHRVIGTEKQNIFRRVESLYEALSTIAIQCLVADGPWVLGSPLWTYSRSEQHCALWGNDSLVTLQLQVYMSTVGYTFSLQYWFSCVFVTPGQTGSTVRKNYWIL